MRRVAPPSDAVADVVRALDVFRVATPGFFAAAPSGAPRTVRHPTESFYVVGVEYPQ